MTPSILKIAADSQLPDPKQPIDTTHSIRISEPYSREEDRSCLLPPKSENKPWSRKSWKKLSSFPCSKRPGKDQLNDSVMIASADDPDAKKNGYNPLRCTYDEKCRIVKQKRGPDGKRLDKKSFKSSGKAKNDPYASNVGFIGSDSVYAGSDIIGIYGLKSVVNDVTKLVEEPSLDELLNGSDGYPNLSLEKGKKASNGNDNVLLSVGKACYVLALNGEESGGNTKSLTSPQSSSLSSAEILDSDVKDKCIEEMSNEDAFQAVVSPSTLYQPKDILERVALPPTQDLEALVLNLNPSQPNMHMKFFCTTCLPPFPWSFSHGGTSKPVDSCKLNLPRTSQSKWVRMRSVFNSTGADNNCSDKLDLGKLDVDLKTLDFNGDCEHKRKIDELQNVKSLAEQVMLDRPEQTSDFPNLFKGSGDPAVLNFRKHKLFGEHADVCCRNSESEVGSRFLESELKLVKSLNSPFKESEVHQMDQHKEAKNGCSGRCYDYHCKSLPGGCGQILRQSPAPELSEPVHSPKLLAAATILCQMASSSSAALAQNNNHTRIKSPKTFSEKNISDHKPQISFDKTERLSMPSRHHDAFRQTCLPSTKHKMKSEKHANNMGREPVRWLLPTEVGSSSPTKHEGNHITTNHRPRFEKACDHHHKLGKETSKAAFSFGGSHIKDWNRERSKRL